MKSIGVSESVYERLTERKRCDESYSDLIDRLLDEIELDWRPGFGSLEESDASQLRRRTRESRRSMSEGLVVRQSQTVESLSDGDDGKETL